MKTEVLDRVDTFFVVKKVVDGRVLFLNVDFGWAPYSKDSAHFILQSLAELAAMNFPGARVDTVEA